MKSVAIIGPGNTGWAAEFDLAPGLAKLCLP